MKNEPEQEIINAFNNGLKRATEIVDECTAERGKTGNEYLIHDYDQRRALLYARNAIRKEINNHWEVNNLGCCQWTEDDDGNWETSCGGIFVIIDGTPTDNEMKFCCYCGRPLREVRRLDHGL